MTTPAEVFRRGYREAIKARRAYGMDTGDEYDAYNARDDEPEEDLDDAMAQDDLPEDDVFDHGDDGAGDDDDGDDERDDAAAKLFRESYDAKTDADDWRRACAQYGR